MDKYPYQTISGIGDKKAYDKAVIQKYLRSQYRQGGLPRSSRRIDGSADDNNDEAKQTANRLD